MNEAAVLNACNALVDLRAWDHLKINARRWLLNFDENDRPTAALLLSRFSYFSDHLVDQLFLSAFQQLSNIVRTDWQPFDTARAHWSSFCSSAYVVPIQGETPNPSDSGWMFARKARQVLGIPEERLVSAKDALSLLYNGRDIPIVFVDDFVGSGEQFRATWQRYVEISSSTFTSFEAIVKRGTTANFFYCNAITTSRGRTNIEAVAPAVRIATGNVIPDELSLSHPTSLMWRDAATRDQVVTMVKRVSHSLGYRDDLGSQNDWEGFHKLGLGLAFEHTIPDATLPIFHTSRLGWYPLVART